MKMTITPFAFLGTPLALLGLASLCSAQGFNLDVQDPTQSLPPDTYGAATTQEGRWNALTPGMIQVPITDVQGSNSTAVTATFRAPAPVLVQATPTSFPSRTIYDDYVLGSPNIQAQFDGLAKGKYSVIAYSWVPNGISPIYISVGSNQPGLPGIVVNGTTFPNPEFHPGSSIGGGHNDGHTDNFWSAVVDVAAGESLYVTVLCRGRLGPNGAVFLDADDPDVLDKGGEGGAGVDAPVALCSLAAIQILPLFGDETCAPTEPNSLGSTPSLSATGSANPDGSMSTAADDLVLMAGLIDGLLPPNRTVLTYVSNVTNVGQPFSCGPTLANTDSARCVGTLLGAGLERILSSNTTSSASGFYSVPVPLGLVSSNIDTSLGRTLYFQMVYWDNVIPADVCQGGPNTLRWTSTRAVLVGP